ncbi:hypothetical protein PLESTB_001298800 [Pleodorina starrii]|uniref:Uncharacterized protein n=1 Tax=Pleodorina starrii TaxID=330485 RepID=A0A9W6F6U4_9CHLO|nr:hypothetical protein PLESTM_000856700 [Pleodorina starrii]GLC57960.1 hypothetical protein PLESTB_001298800 [Pleodorina starrii]GLC76756.1 hypothetical protein PLESTF_001830200 [Pleodorina starrii]
MASTCARRCTAGCSVSSRNTRKVVVTYAAADNQLLKKPDVKGPESKRLFSDAATSATSAASAVNDGRTTIEYQRQRAKEIRQYFLDQKASELREQAQVFGWTQKNEISNGRWVMFGLLVGMLTEYATGVDFIDQLKLMVSYLGIADLD